MNVAAVLLCAGCYASVRPGVTAPIGHGHGTAGFDVAVSGGVERRTPDVRAGGGVELGARFADDNGFVPLAIGGHVAVAVAGGSHDDWRPLLVAHGAAGYGVGLDVKGAPDQTAPSGLFVQGFLGFGLGATWLRETYGVHPGHVAIGLSGTRYVPDTGGAFWFLGGAVEGNFGFGP